LNKWCNTKGINYYEGIEALGLLFEWAVPKFGYTEIEFLCDTNGVGYYVQLEDATGNIVSHSLSWHETPALALFWAIWEIIENER